MGRKAQRKVGKKKRRARKKNGGRSPVLPKQESSRKGKEGQKKNDDIGTPGGVIKWAGHNMSCDSNGFPKCPAPGEPALSKEEEKQLLHKRKQLFDRY